MKRIAKYTLWLLPLVLMTVAFTEYPSTRQDFEISKNLEIFANTYKELNTGYVDELDPGKVMRDGMEAMLTTSILSPITSPKPTSKATACCAKAPPTTSDLNSKKLVTSLPSPRFFRIYLPIRLA